MNPHCLLFWFGFWFFGYPACLSVFKILGRKNKGIAAEGLHIEAYTHLQHWDLILGCAFPCSHTVRRQSIKRGEPRQMPSLPHTAESTVREEHFSSRRVSAHLSLGAEGCSEVQRSQGGGLQSHTLSKASFATITVFCLTKFGFDVCLGIWLQCPMLHCAIMRMLLLGFMWAKLSLQLRNSVMLGVVVPLFPPALI